MFHFYRQACMRPEPVQVSGDKKNEDTHTQTQIKATL